MTYQTLTYAVSDRVATITLNRPERMNAINLANPVFKLTNHPIIKKVNDE